MIRGLVSVLGRIKAGGEAPFPLSAAGASADWAKAWLERQKAVSASAAINDFGMSCPPLTRNRVHKPGSDGNLQNGPQTAKPRLAQSYVAAVDPRNVTGDGKAEAGGFGVLVARVVEPIERPEHLVPLVFRDAGAVILDLDHERAVLTSGTHSDKVGESHGVVDEIGDGALEGMAAKGHHQGRIAAIDTDLRFAVGLVAHLGQNLADIGAHDLFARGALGEGDIVLQHGLHLVDISAHGVELRRLLEHGELQLEAGEHGAQVVADTGEHDGALLDMALDAVAHLDESLVRLTCRTRATRTEVRRSGPTLAEAFGGFRQTQDRLDLVAQEKDRHGEQHERGAQHPQQKDLRVRRISLAAACQHIHHRVVKLDANIDEVRVPNRVDPEGLSDLARDLVG